MFEPHQLTGTPSQIEWAEQIRPRVDAEFDRVEKAFRRVAANQLEEARLETLAILAVLEEKRLEVLSHPEAGYFIRYWQELGDQVRRIIAEDPRYQAIKFGRLARRDLTRPADLPPR